MIAAAQLFGPPALAAAAAAALWIVLDLALRRRIRSRLRAVPLCLPLVLLPVGYALFWWGFFSSPAAAVRLHATWLTIRHAAGPFLPWIAGAWLITALAALWPLARRP